MQAVSRWRAAALAVTVAAALSLLPITVESAAAVGTGSISGTLVSGDDKQPMVGSTVSLVRAESGSVVIGNDVSGGDGSFTFPELAPGHYTLMGHWYSTTWFYDQTIYYPHAADVESAEFFSLAEGQTITGKMLEFNYEGSVSGKVTDPSGQPLMNIAVDLYDATAPIGSPIVGKGNSFGDGRYSLSVPGPGTYILSFNGRGASGASRGYSTEWWPGTSSRATAQTFTVVGHEFVTDMDAQLDLAGHVTGTVKNTSGAGIPSVIVTAYSAASGDFESSVATDSAGGYNLDHLSPGAYTLRFTDLRLLRYASEWWNDKPTRAAATPVTVTGGATVTGTDVVLANYVKASSVSGTVTGANDAALGGIGVQLIDANDAVVFGSSTTASNGAFAIANVPAGTYSLKFADPSHGYPTEFLGDAASLAEATLFDVGSAAVVMGRNAHLDLGATISGTVSDASTGAVLPYAGVVVYESAEGQTVGGVVARVKASHLGAYSVPNLPLGTYTVGFTASSSGYSPATGELLQPKTFASVWYGGGYDFATAQTVTLDELGQVASGIDQSLLYPTFGDASDPASPFYTYIAWAYSSGISTGTPTIGKPSYKPVDAVSRQAMAQFLYRLSGDTFSAPTTASFADVAVGSTFFTAVEWMKAQGIALGTTQPSGLPLFKPGDAVSRQSMATFLSRYDGVILESATDQSFADVPLEASTAPAIEWMTQTGISTGTPQSSGLPLYKPSDPVSRQAMAAFLYRLAHLPA